MSDTVFYNKVKALLDQLDILFHQEWDDTLGHLDKTSVGKFIDDNGTFLEPEGDNELESWSGRDRFLNAYRGAVVAMMRMERGATSPQAIRPQEAGDASAPISVYPAAAMLGDGTGVKSETGGSESLDNSSPKEVVKDEKESGRAPVLPKPASFTEAVIGKAPIKKQDDSDSIASENVSHEGQLEPGAVSSEGKAVTPTQKSSEKGSDQIADSTQVGLDSPKISRMPGMGMPKPKTGPQGFPSPFSKPASMSQKDLAEDGKEVSSRESGKIEPSTGKVVFAGDEPSDEELTIREKYEHLLKDVKQEKIRDFILADGANTNTGKPSMIIHIPTGVWLEFAFDFSEGKRILDKYPQRDPELIEFMKVSGHTE